MSWSRPEVGDWSSPAELAQLQRAELPRVIAQALRSPFYSARYEGRSAPKSAEDFSDIELTTKQDLRDAYPFGMLAVGREKLATYHESSGTAGDPTASYYTDDDWADLAERYARKWVGIEPSDTFLVRTPYGLVITAHLAQAAGRLKGATIVPGDARSLATPLPRMIRVMRALDVSLTWCNPTEIMMLAAAAKAAGLRPHEDFPALRAMFTAAEPLTEVRRRRLSEIWGGIPIVEEYGSTETGTIAGQCPDGRMHLWADRAVFEVYDPETGEVSSSGRGQLVVTPLYREAMPLLRYNLADDVEVSDAECGCGWLLPTVKVLGRSGTDYEVGTATVNQQRLEELVFSLPASYDVMFWRAMAHRDVLRLEFEAPEESRDAAAKELSELIDREVGVPYRITGVPLGTLVPTETLTAHRDMLKARYLWGEGENWDKAVMYA